MKILKCFFHENSFLHEEAKLNFLSHSRVWLKIIYGGFSNFRSATRKKIFVEASLKCGRSCDKFISITLHSKFDFLFFANRHFYKIFANYWNALGNKLHLLNAYKQKKSINKQISFEFCIFLYSVTTDENFFTPEGFIRILFWVFSTSIDERQGVYESPIKSPGEWIINFVFFFKFFISTSQYYFRVLVF